MEYSRIEIKTKGNPPSAFTEVYIDGHQIKGIRSYNLNHGAGNELPTLTLDLNALDVSVDSPVEKVKSLDGREIIFKDENESCKSLQSIDKHLEENAKRFDDRTTISSKELNDAIKKHSTRMSNKFLNMKGDSK